MATAKARWLVAQNPPRLGENRLSARAGAVGNAVQAGIPAHRVERLPTIGDFSGKRLWLPDGHGI